MASKKNIKKIAKKQAKKVVKAAKADKKEKGQKKERHMALRIIPYVLVSLSLVIAACFIMMNFEGGVGAVGLLFGKLICAVMGFGAYMIPIGLGYASVKWIIHNIKWDPAYIPPTGDERIDYIKAKRRLVLQCVMTALLVLVVTAFAGVVAGQDSFDPFGAAQEAMSDFDSRDFLLVGGGAVGATLSFLLLEAVGSVVSILVLIILALFFGIFALGLTPDYIIIKIKEWSAIAAERKKIENEMLAKRREEEKQKQKEEQLKAEKQRLKPQPLTVSQPAPQKAVKQIDVDELVADTQPEPVKEVPIIDPEPKKGRKTAEPTPTPTPLDFGGDSSFDKGEFDNIDNILKGFGTPIAPSKPLYEAPEKKEPTPAPAPTPTPAPASIDMSEMTADDLLEDVAEVVPDDEGEIVEIEAPYVFPSVDMLTPNRDVDDGDHTEELRANAQALVETLRSFRVGVREVTYSRGPTITRYELKPEVGTRVRSIANLVDDIALNLATSGVRIEAPIPGKAAVGIEVPNQTRSTVYLRDLIDSPKFSDSKSRLTAALGMDVGGNPIHFDIGKMPHLLIAGTTGSGKSICINCIIMSILYKAKPQEVKLILIDPKKVEFNMYKGIPHLYCPIVSEPKKAAGALASAVAEMERRFELIEQAGVRDIASYNAAAETDPELEFMPQMVIIIDELADLMMTARDEVETSICRIAQKARAAGIHMILGTQRPSVDVITGLIKANVPSRIACTVMSQVDSRTIIDVAGAENLIGRGDMLFAPVGASKPIRVQGAFVSETEIDRIVTFVKENNGQAKYNNDFINRIEIEAAKCGAGKKGAAEADMPEIEGGDTKFSEAVKLAIETGKLSTSLMQRRLGVGYGRAAKIIDTMEQMGYVSAPDGNKPRQVLITMDEYMRRVSEGNLGGADV